jgi:putative spermidine/putrescine transport system ATP-binding protein
MPVAIEFNQVIRQFGDFRAVDGVSFAIADGEFFTFLGPSGSGKTTCLRMIAGFDQPTSGDIRLFGKDVTQLPPYQRDVNTVFQDYALFPHMNVADNVGYGLMVRGVPKAERTQRVAEALEMVQLSHFGSRKPAQLSGGQKQRVALARALINRPRVLLLDEPLGALDLKLRQQMQIELKTIQQQVGITFIYVTHDQEEALTMSDRIAVFDHGKLQQVGAPADLYERPDTAFVANFIGTSNLLGGEPAQSLVGAPQAIAIRPEKMHLHLQGESLNAPYQQESCKGTGTVKDVVYLGLYTRFLVEMDAGVTLTVIDQNRAGSAASVAALKGSRVWVSWERSANIALKG